MSFIPPTEQIDLAHVSSLFPDEIKRAKEYFGSYFVPLSNASHAKYCPEQKKFIILDEKSMKVYLKRIPKPLSQWYECENKNVREIVFELNQPVFIGNKKLNLCPSFKHTYSPFSDFPQDIKKKWKSSNGLF
jgi:hypothetical protein